MSLKTLKRLISSSKNEESVEVPEVGFKILYCEEKMQLIVRVIGARHLPTSYGNNKPNGYVMKVDNLHEIGTMRY